MEVTCYATKETGDNKDFIKIKGKYYKSQEIHDNYIKDVDNRYKLNKIITDELLNGDITLGGYVGKRIKNITIDTDVLLIIFDENKQKLINKMPSIQSGYGKVNYIFAVIEEQISR